MEDRLVSSENRDGEAHTALSSERIIWEHRDEEAIHSLGDGSGREGGGFRIVTVDRIHVPEIRSV